MSSATPTGDLQPILISTPLAEAELYTYGAHITQWTPRGQRPVLYLSPRSLFTPGKAIRGGVPIIFPWFGPRSDGRTGPAHGFARTMEWKTDGPQTRDDGKIEITLTLAPSEATRALLDIDFHSSFRVTIGSELEMELQTHNAGKQPFTYEEALHTYLAVGDIHQVSISGLDATTYLDKTDDCKRKTQLQEPISFTQETDRMYLNTTATSTVDDPAWNRRIIVEKSGSNTTVVWNPWMEKTAAMSDMAPDGWKQMVCVETTNAAENAITLGPGVSHKLTAKIRVE
ncbi:MAG: D-hexose-6-phosphate mutarotase [Acidobacteriota bacterium]